MIFVIKVYEKQLRLDQHQEKNKKSKRKHKQDLVSSNTDDKTQDMDCALSDFYASINEYKETENNDEQLMNDVQLPSLNDFEIKKRELIDMIPSFIDKKTFDIRVPDHDLLPTNSIPHKESYTITMDKLNFYSLYLDPNKGNDKGNQNRRNGRENFNSRSNYSRYDKKDYHNQSSSKGRNGQRNYHHSQYDRNYKNERFEDRNGYSFKNKSYHDKYSFDSHKNRSYRDDDYSHNHWRSSNRNENRSSYRPKVDHFTDGSRVRNHSDRRENSPFSNKSEDFYDNHSTERYNSKPCNDYSKTSEVGCDYGHTSKQNNDFISDSMIHKLSNFIKDMKEERKFVYNELDETPRDHFIVKDETKNDCGSEKYCPFTDSISEQDNVTNDFEYKHEEPIWKVRRRKKQRQERYPHYPSCVIKVS